MKQTLIALAIASTMAAGSAFACSDNCSASSSVTGSGGFVGGAANVIGAKSAVVGTGTSHSEAASSAYSESRLGITATGTGSSYAGTAAGELNITSSTFNAGSASASNVSTGNGTGGAVAGAVAGSAVIAGGTVRASGSNASGVAQIGFVEGSGVAVGASAGKNQSGGSVEAWSGSVVNAVAGVKVESCADVAKVTAYVGDSKAVATDVDSTGSAAGVALAGAGFVGTHSGTANVNATFGGNNPVDDSDRKPGKKPGKN